MNVKVLMLAGSLAVVVAALIFGADMCAQAGKSQDQAAKAEGQQAGQVEVPTAADGVPAANRKLQKFKKGMQEQMNKRGQRIDRRADPSAGQP